MTILAISFLYPASTNATTNNLEKINFSYFLDTSVDLNYNDIQDVKFIKSSTNSMNFGITKANVWLKINIPNTNHNYSILDFSNTSIENAVLYYNIDEIDSKGEFNYSAENNKYSNSTYFELNSELIENSTIYIKLSTSKLLNLNLKLTNIDETRRSNNVQNTVILIYFGVILALFGYNLFLYISLKEVTYLLYLFLILTVALNQIIIYGYGEEFLYGDNTWLSKRTFSLISALSGFATALYTISFNNLKTNSKLFYKIFKIYGYAYIFIFGISIIGLTHLANLALFILGSSSIIIIIAGVTVYRKGFNSAKYFTIAFIFFSIGVTLFASRLFGFIGDSFLANFALPIGSAIQILLLSFALADKINVLKRDKEQATEDKMDLLQENKNLIEKKKEELETLVSERTFELSESNSQLSSAFNELKSTQNQLIESEKLASLGQLTAGIAHELNNPINFISGNVNPLKRDIKDLLDLIQVYDDVLSNKKSEYEIETFKNTIELDYLKKEIDMLLDGISDGSTRTAEIVGSLKLYSHMDNTDKFALGDINNGIESTVVILRSNYREDCKVTVDLDDELPLIECQIGKINQVLMNLISNAIHATMARHFNRIDRVVHISSRKSNSEIKIIVKDNGTGMDETTRNKIFDPFFTTKKQGKGTGLGLSLVKSMVDTHQGNLKINSELGKGTEFILTLPIHIIKKSQIYQNDK